MAPIIQHVENSSGNTITDVERSTKKTVTEDDLLGFIQRLSQGLPLSDEELHALISAPPIEDVNASTTIVKFALWEETLFKAADSVRQSIYGKNVFVRGLIEFTNFCKNDCYYCGIRCSNHAAKRYRLTEDDILSCCREGYALGFRTFVLQGGEDLYFTDKKICQIISSIKSSWPDCAVTLSIGEKTKESYQSYFNAGADRYLLRHETADRDHYQRLHPAAMSFDNRRRCLADLKEIGYAVGAGFMVGSPGQTPSHLVKDLRFLQELSPQMIGIGPYLVSRDTPFKREFNGSMRQTLRLLSILRLMHPYALLPSTTALGTIHPQGREYGLLAGANVIMPNLSPSDVRQKYALYEKKICTGSESAQCRTSLEHRVQAIGYKIVTDRGDPKQPV